MRVWIEVQDFAFSNKSGGIAWELRTATAASVGEPAVGCDFNFGAAEHDFDDGVAGKVMDEGIGGLSGIGVRGTRGSDAVVEPAVRAGSTEVLETHSSTHISNNSIAHELIGWKRRVSPG